MNATNRRRCESPDHCDGWVDVAGANPMFDHFRACDTCGGRHEVRFHVEPKLRGSPSWIEWAPPDMDEHVVRVRALIKRTWGIVPDDDPGDVPGGHKKLRLDIEAGPARGPTTAGTIHVSFHSTYEYREEAWRAFEAAVEVLAAAGYERVDSGRGALTRGSGFFCPIAAPDG